MCLFNDVTNTQCYNFTPSASRVWSVRKLSYAIFNKTSGCFAGFTNVNLAHAIFKGSYYWNTDYITSDFSRRFSHGRRTNSEVNMKLTRLWNSDAFICRASDRSSRVFSIQRTEHKLRNVARRTRLLDSNSRSVKTDFRVAYCSNVCM